MLSIKNRDTSFSLDNTTFTTYYLDGEKQKREISSIDDFMNVFDEVFNIEVKELPNLKHKLSAMLSEH